jgi:predicted nucleic acid-binding protein
MAILAATARVPSVLALQVIGEYYVATTRKVRLNPGDIRDRVQDLLSTFRTSPHMPRAMAIGASLAAQGRYFYWDAVLLASAEEAGCTVMLSEDMADGSKLGKLIVRNPFGLQGLSDAAKQHSGFEHQSNGCRLIA